MSDVAAVTAVGQNAMAVENDPFVIPLQVKYVEAQTATVKRKRLEPETPKIQVVTPEKAEFVKRAAHQVITPTIESPLSEAPTPDESPMTETPNTSATPSKFQYDPNLSYAEKVAHEMIVTERVYLDNLKQIIDGFLDPATNNSELAVTKENIDDLFINVEEIYNFNWILLQDMEECEYNPVKLAECFVSQQIGFGVYTKYCTHYPRSMDVLLEWTQREDTANFIKKQQAALGHTLPLCSFLLKPVQRILKYHLLLGNIAKHYKQSEDEEGYEIIQKALSAMTNVAKHINDMKRKHEDALRSQEIQSVLLEYEGPNLTSYGSLVLEDTFRLHGTKTGRYLLLFEKALLITKRRSDGTFTWKATIEYSNMMLADSVFREPLTFQVIPFDDRKMCYTFVSRDLDTKNIWLLELKQRLLDSYTVKVPTKAKEIILGKSRDCEKENTEPDNETKGASSPSNTIKRAVNLHRSTPQKEKDSNHNGTKLHKILDSDNRKSKDSEELLEDKASALMDSIRSPLRRKLRVFKKRKFSKEQMKQPKTVSWSSDDYEHGGENEVLSPCENNGEEGLIMEHQGESEKHDTEVAHGNKHIETSNEVQEKEDRTSTESPVMDDTVTDDTVTDDTVLEPKEGENTTEDSPSATPPPVGNTKPTTIAVKKRRLTKEDRAKSASMPAEELLSRASMALKEQRSFSLNGLEDNNQKDLVRLRENSALIRNRRLGSNEDPNASLEGHLRRNPGVDNLTDDITMSTIEDESSVSHTIRCVSAAFSDISPSFSRGDSPTSSTEENSVTLDEESDDTETFREGDSSGDENTPGEQNSVVDDNNIDDNNGHATTIWDRMDFIRTENGNGLHEEGDDTSVDMSCNDKTTPVASGTSSYNDTLSESSDEGTRDSSPRFNGIYQRVFQLRRSHSEDNLSSQPSVTEDDYRTHGVVTRSRSTESSPNQRWSNANPFAFTLTPKKKIVIKDSLWETINEDVEVTQIAIATTKNNELCARRRKKRKGRRKRSCSENRGQRAEYDPHLPSVPRTASLEILHYHSAPPKEKVLDVENNQDVEIEKQTNSIDSDTKSENSPSELELPIPEVRESECEMLRCVDDNVSEVPATVNYLCIEHVPPDESPHKETCSISSGRTSDVLGDLEEELLQIEIIAAQSVKSIVKNAIDEVSRREDQETKMADSQVAVTAVDDKPLHNDDSVDNQVTDSPPDNRASFHDTGTPSVVGHLEKETPARRMVEDKSMNRLLSDSDESKKRTFEERKPSRYTTGDGDEEVFKQKGSISDSQSSNIKQKLEELRRRKRSLEGKTTTTRDKFGNLPNIRDRINVLKRSSWHEARAGRSRQDADVALARAAPNVRNIMTRLEQVSTPDQPEVTNLSGQLQTSLSIQDRVNSLRHESDEGRHASLRRSNSMDEEMPTWQRLKDRIETLRGDKQHRDSEHERDITISDGSHLTSPRQNDELKTVVIKRGWVQQFVQKLETGS